MKRFVYPIYVAGIICFISILTWRDFRGGSGLSGGAIWIVLAVSLVYAGIALYLRTRYKALFQREKSSPASVVFSNQERFPDLPEEFGTWPSGRLFLAEARSDGLTLRDRTKAVAHIPRGWIARIEIDDVEFFRAAHAPAVVFSNEGGLAFPLVPSSRFIPGNFTTRKRVKQIADVFAQQLS